MGVFSVLFSLQFCSIYMSTYIYFSNIMDNDDREKGHLENLGLSKFAKTKLFPVLNSENYA